MFVFHKKFFKKFSNSFVFNKISLNHNLKPLNPLQNHKNHFKFQFNPNDSVSNAARKGERKLLRLSVKYAIYVFSHAFCADTNSILR